MNARNRNYVVTGGSSEIGGGILHHLKQLGCESVVTTSFRNEIKTHSPGWLVLNNLNLTEQSAINTLQQAVTEKFDNQFTIIHSVGSFWVHRPIHKTPLLEAKDLVLSHYLTLYSVAHSLFPIAANLGGGTLFAFSCNSVSYNYPEMAAFTSAKAAVECLVKCLANEWSGCNISSNTIALPTIKTKGVERLHQNNQKVGNLSEYITVEDLVKEIFGILNNSSSLQNGNIYKVFSPSSNFFGKSYFDRNPSQVGREYV